MEIAELDALLRDIPNVSTGSGPLHPRTPDRTLQGVIEHHLATLGLVAADRHYAAFLLAFAGARVEYPDGSVYIDIFGFCDGVSTNLLYPGGGYIDPQGYYLFCSSIFRPADSDALTDTTGVEFALDPSGNRQSGVYRSFTRMGVEGAYSHYCASFIEWLGMLALNAGEFAADE